MMDLKTIRTELRKLTGDGFDFRFADRLLYQVDKAPGRKLGSCPGA